VAHPGRLTFIIDGRDQLHDEPQLTLGFCRQHLTVREDVAAIEATHYLPRA
jgi:hypothetical protein